MLVHRQLEPGLQPHRPPLECELPVCIDTHRVSAGIAAEMGDRKRHGLCLVLDMAPALGKWRPAAAAPFVWLLSAFRARANLPLPVTRCATPLRERRGVLPV